MALDLEGRNVVITGASSGIGWHLARILARKGANLAISARRVGRLEDLRAAVVESGGRPPLVVPCDVSRSDQVEELHRKVAAEWDRGADVLVINAGRGAYGSFEHVPTADLEAVVATNLLGAIFCAKAFLPDMVGCGGGSIVFVSSVLGELPAPDHAVYGATKFALTGLAESLRYELAGSGVGVTLVEPGLVLSEFAEVSGTPLQRFERLPAKSPEETAELIVHAMEREQSYVVTDRLAKLGIDLRRHFPRATRFLFGRAWSRLRGKGEGPGQP
jgi:short-subunit dehydrogenase